MNEDDASLGDEGSDAENVREVGVESDLPRIIVEEDRIIVLDSEENSWREKNMERDVLKEDAEEEVPVSVDLSLGERVSGVMLEELVGSFTGSEEKVRENEGIRDDEFYEIGVAAGDFYKDEAYNEKAGGDENYDIDIDVKRVDEIEEERRGRSMLEIAGFRDEEAEKKRKEKREGSFI